MRRAHATRRPRQLTGSFRGYRFRRSPAPGWHAPWSGPRPEAHIHALTRSLCSLFHSCPGVSRSRAVRVHRHRPRAVGIGRRVAGRQYGRSGAGRSESGCAVTVRRIRRPEHLHVPRHQAAFHRRAAHGQAATPSHKLWYESDFYATLGFGFGGGGVSLATTYTAYTSPNNTFSSVKEIMVKLSVDDSTRLGRAAIKPYVALARELDTAPGVGQRPGDGVGRGRLLVLARRGRGH